MNKKRKSSGKDACFDPVQIARIRRYEELFDGIAGALGDLKKASSAFEEQKPKIAELTRYYESDLWKKDFSDDEAGRLPRDLKRGVLSEDAVYDLLCEIDALTEKTSGAAPAPAEEPREDAARKGSAVTLAPLTPDDRERFILDNQEAFNYGALEEFGRRDDHFEEEGEIISRETIGRSIDEGEAYRILKDGKTVGGAVISVREDKGDLELLFIAPGEHGKGIGQAAWRAIEALHPEVRVWETCTPYFEKRNIHFYVNRCGFHVVEFFCAHHPDPNDPDRSEDGGEQFEEGMFRFEKRIGR